MKEKQTATTNNILSKVGSFVQKKKQAYYLFFRISEGSFKSSIICTQDPSFVVCMILKPFHTALQMGKQYNYHNCILTLKAYMKSRINFLIISFIFLCGNKCDFLQLYLCTFFPDFRSLFISCGRGMPASYFLEQVPLKKVVVPSQKISHYKDDRRDCGRNITCYPTCSVQ